MHLLFNILLLVPLVHSYSHQSTRINHHRRHSTLSRLQPRGFRATFYDVGLGACGKTNVPSDFVVALNSAQFDSAPDHDCFKTITITCNGKTTNAQIVDRCPGCPYGGLDMSTSLFQFFQSDLGVGVLDVDWDFADGEGAPNQAPPPPSSSQAPPPPSTLKPSKTKASQTSAPTTSTQIQLPSSQATSDVQASTSAVLSSSTGGTSTTEFAPPSPSTATVSSSSTTIVSDPSSSLLPQPGGGNNIAQLGSLVVRLGLLVESAENKS